MCSLRNLAIIFLLFLLVPPLLTSYWLITNDNKFTVQSIITTQYAHIHILKHYLESFLMSVTDELQFLSQSPFLRDYLEWRYRMLTSTPSESVPSESVVLTTELEKKRQSLAAEFLLFSRYHDIYDQIRYLDETGQEIVRINSSGTTSQIVADKKLQNKADRYYFKETMQLSAEEIFVSPLDLNRENDNLERPLKPVIRYAKLVYYNSARKAGIVILNINANYFLKLLQDVRLIDSKGYFLNHPIPYNCWGGPHDLNTGYQFSTEYPQLATRALEASGIYETNNQIVLLQQVKVPQASYHWTLVFPQDKKVIPQLITPFYLVLIIMPMVIGLTGLIWLNLKLQRFPLS